MSTIKLNQPTRQPFWMATESEQNCSEDLKKRNAALEADYHKVLQGIKKLYETSGRELAFERNYKVDQSGNNSFAIHSFMTKSCYWYLNCDECGVFAMYYLFEGCPFEREINEIIATEAGQWFISDTLIEPDLATAFKRYKQLFGDKFFSILKGN
jgi:hypothetical protein